MSLRSALEDFVGTTLGSIAGIWGKLRYVAELRTQDGRYAHWGLERLHGDVAVQRALRQAHHALYLGVLRTPLRELVREAEESAAEMEVDYQTYVDELQQLSATMPPGEPSGGSEEHFRTVLEALSRLAPGRRRANPPGA